MKAIKRLDKRINGYFQIWSKREKILLGLTIYLAILAFDINLGQVIETFYYAGRDFGESLAKWL